MSKVKSAIITSLLVIAIIIAAFFATVSYPIGTTQRYNSMASSIHLGGDLTGYVYTTLYPEGVISAQDYKFLTEDEAEEYVSEGGVYVKSDEDKSALSANVVSDAAVINSRLEQKGYSGYSVSVEDGLTIKISVPSNYTYAAYKGNNSATLSTDLSVATASLTSLSVGGDMTIRTTDRTITTDDDQSYTYTSRIDEYTDTALVSSSKTYSLTKVTEDVSSFFKSITSRMIGATPVITLNLTQTGQERFRDITTLVASSDSQSLYIFMGDTLMLSVSCTTTFNTNKLQLQSDSAESAENIAIVLNSAINGGVLKATYNPIDRVVEGTASAGENAALFSFIACILIIVIAAVLLIVRYKKLGIVASLISVIYALVIVYALFILEIQLTFVGIIASVIGLILLILSNVTVFEEVRKHTAVGKTMQASVKAAYKSTVMAVADLHIVLFVAALLATLIGVGEVASCGFIMIIATIASYILYWFTRFMWYVVSSPVRDKFGFGGYKRVVYDD